MARCVSRSVNTSTWRHRHARFVAAAGSRGAASIDLLPSRSTDRPSSTNVAHAADGGELALQAARWAGRCGAGRSDRHRAGRARRVTQSSTRSLTITRYCGKKTMPAGSQCAKRMRSSRSKRGVRPRRSRRLAQLEALQLAGLGARQPVAELDRARVLVGRDGLLDEVLQRRAPWPASAAPPGLSTTKALTIWPRSSSGTPITPHSATSGWRSSASSTSGPAML